MTATVVQTEKAGPYTARVELQIERAFKGVSEDSRLVLLHFIGGTCAVPLEAGQQYLLFARLFSESDYPGQYEIIAVRGEPAIQAIAVLERGH